MAAVKKTIDEGGSIIDVSQQHFGAFCRYRNSFRDYLLLNSTPRSSMPRISVLWGPTGTGKSFRAFSTGKDAGSMFVLSRPSSRSGTLWFDGFARQKVLVIEEFYGWIRYDFLLRLLDKYPLNVEVKGSSVSFDCEHIIFTSNRSWRSWYSLPDLSALERRLSKETSEVFYMGHQKEEPGFVGPMNFISESKYEDQLAIAAEYREEVARQKRAKLNLENKG